MNKLTLALVASASLGTLAGSANAASDWEFNQARTLRHSAIFDFKDIDHPASIFYDTLQERRSAATDRLQMVWERQGNTKFWRQMSRRIVRRVEGRSWWPEPEEAFRNAMYSNIQALEINEDPDLPYNPNQETPEVPIPAAVWLFASALGYLGWRRKHAAADDSGAAAA